MEDVVRVIVFIAGCALVFAIGERLARRLMGPSEAGKAAITESSNLEQRLGDLERRHNKTRELLINYVSLTTALLVGLLMSFYFKLDGDIAFIIVLGAAYAVTNVLGRRLLKG